MSLRLRWCILCFVDSIAYKKTKPNIIRRRQNFLGVEFPAFFFSRVKLPRIDTGLFEKRPNILPRIQGQWQPLPKPTMENEAFLQCPECGTIYSVQVEEVESQRAVRCGECLHEWLATEEDLLEMDPSYLNSLIDERREAKEKGSFTALEKEKERKVLGALDERTSDNNEASSDNYRAARNSESVTREEEKVLFVGNLSYKASEKDLFRLFSSCGQVLDVRIPRNNPKAHRGFAFVKMSLAGASIALQRLQGANIVGRPIVLSESITQQKTSVPEQEEEKESSPARNTMSFDDAVTEEDWDTDFGPDEQLLGQEAYSDGLRIYLRGSNSRRKPQEKT